MYLCASKSNDSKNKVKETEQIARKTSAKDATYDHVLKYIGVLGSVQGLKMLVQLVRNKLSSVLLHSEGVGLGATLSNISELIHNATNLGLSFGTVRNLSELFEEGTEEQRVHFVRVIRTWAVWTALLGALLCLGLSVFLCKWFFDGDTSYTLTVCLLSLFIFTMPLEAVECAIVKGMRRLKSLAMIETTVVFGCFALTIPLYYLLGMQGIVLSLILSGFFTLAVHLVVTTRMFPWSVSLFSKEMFREGLPLLKLGVPYVVAGVATTLSTSFIYGALEDLHEVGLYRQGFMMISIVAGLFFSAMDSDYFPRLSSANHDSERMNNMANQQIQVNVLLVTPVLIVISLFMSRLIYLISSIEFIQVAPMVVCSVFYVFFKGVYTPVSYYPLAKGNSLLFMVAEVVYDVVVAALVYYGYVWGQEYLDLVFDGISCSGLMGAGIALSLASLFDTLMVQSLYGMTYGFRLQRRTVVLVLCEMLCLLATLPMCLMTNVPLQKYSIGIVTLSVSLLLAWRMLSKESSFFQRIAHKLRVGGHHDGCC